MAFYGLTFDPCACVGLCWLVAGWVFYVLKIGLYTPSPKLTKLTFQIGSQRRHSILDVWQGSEYGSGSFSYQSTLRRKSGLIQKTLAQISKALE